MHNTQKKYGQNAALGVDQQQHFLARATQYQHNSNLIATLKHGHKAAAVSIWGADAQNPERPEVEGFIKDVFAVAHHAELHSFMPELFYIRDQHQEITGAIGLRRIAGSPIFLEQYLQSPVEQVVAGMTGSTVSRKQIVEIGNFASLRKQASLDLIAFLIHFTYTNNMPWVVCTGTHAVRRLLEAMRVDYQLIKKAEATCLGSEQVHWGSYYRHNPFVILIDAGQAYKNNFGSYVYKPQG